MTCFFIFRFLKSPILVVTVTALLLIIMPSILGKKAKRKLPKGDLVVPWSEVRSIKVVNESSKKGIAAYVHLGDWVIETFYGNTFVIHNVPAPSYKLEHIKEKFGLAILTN
ncbi:hypothetical protein [Acidianus sp. HS-5]|uniref:hypothetical protein n=1 Tax=Acidianus sp. HS-5 TaxID=2886040 RepID=UPI001F3DBC26|nr:hypothetical protein [Acidianus sp. HS-5]